MDKRPELRIPNEIPVRIWGMDADGHPFFQSASAGNLSTEGARLTRLRHSLKIGEIIGLQHGDSKARFHVIWVKTSPAPGRNEAGLRILPHQVIPWVEVTANSLRRVMQSQPGVEKRRFTRHKVQFPLEISFPDDRRAHMQCSATDMGGRGCYVETLVPLQMGTVVLITFWLDSDKIKTSGVVRASDPGVGMGIEFTALESHIQQRLQQYLEKIDHGFVASASTGV